MVDVNYLAILVCGVAAMIIGFLWYGPLFGRHWSKLMGWGEMTPEKMKEAREKAMPSYAVSFVGALVMAFVLSHHLVFAGTYMQTEGLMAGLSSGFWIWLGFIAPVTLGSVLWDGKPFTLWLINGGYYLVQLLAMGTILSLWV